MGKTLVSPASYQTAIIIMVTVIIMPMMVRMAKKLSLAMRGTGVTFLYCEGTENAFFRHFFHCPSVYFLRFHIVKNIYFIFIILYIFILIVTEVKFTSSKNHHK